MTDTDKNIHQFTDINLVTRTGEVAFLFAQSVAPLFRDGLDYLDLVKKSETTLTYVRKIEFYFEKHTKTPNDRLAFFQQIIFEEIMTCLNDDPHAEFITSLLCRTHTENFVNTLHHYIQKHQVNETSYSAYANSLNHDIVFYNNNKLAGNVRTLYQNIEKIVFNSEQVRHFFRLSLGDTLAPFLVMAKTNFSFMETL